MQDRSQIANYSSNKKFAICDVHSQRRRIINASMKLKLRALREKRGWTQEEVASRSGMSKSFYSEIESGKKAANSQRLRKFAEVFEVPAFELIDDSSIDDELLEHLRTMQSLDVEDRKAVIRHALGLADD